MENNNNQEQQKEQMGFTLKTRMCQNMQEQPIEQAQTDNKEVEPIETEENGEGTETSAFVPNACIPLTCTEVMFAIEGVAEAKLITTKTLASTKNETQNVFCLFILIQIFNLKFLYKLYCDVIL